MKKFIASVVLVTSVWGTMLTSTKVPATSKPITASGSAQVGTLHAYTSQPVTIPSTFVDNAQIFIADNKKAIFVLAVAITLGLSLKYCSWVQGLVGIDTEAEIDDWRVHIQD